jgi:predicted enzyme related to lactoylglutathione lyase
MQRMPNSIGWFEVATSQPETSEQFYGSLFDWTFADDPDMAGNYRLVSPAGDQPAGGILSTEGELPNYAIFYVTVDDVRATAANAEKLGGKVLVPATDAPSGLVFAHVLDPDGNQFGIFTPPHATVS